MKNNTNLRKTMAWLLTLVMLLGMLPVNATQTHLHEGEGEGEAALYADLTQDGGVYQIGTADELFAFAALVNGGEYGADAALTADIDLGGAVWQTVTSTDLYYEAATPYSDAVYSGTFDGAGHTIKNFVVQGVSGTKCSVGLFGTAKGATVKNLGVDGMTFELNDATDVRAAAIVGQMLEGTTVENCYVANSTLTPNAYIVGAVAACNYGGTIRNCFSVNNAVSGHTRCGNLVGDCRGDGGADDRPGTVTNCWTDAAKLHGDNYVASLVNECHANAGLKLKNGEAAYKLGEGWGQTVGSDEYPVFGGAKLYAVSCSGEGTAYSNVDAAMEHNFSGNQCANCGKARGSLSVRLHNYYGYKKSYGAYIAVYKNGEPLHNVELNGVEDLTWTCPDYDSAAAYTVFFYGGENDVRLECQIHHNGTQVYSKRGLDVHLDGALLFNSCASHNYVNGTCSKCLVPCAHPMNARTQEDLCANCSLTVPSEIIFGTVEGDYTAGRGNFEEVVKYFNSTGGTYYAKLCKDVTLTKYVDFGGSKVTLDLAGHVITSAAEDDALYLRNNGVLTIDDSGVGGTVRSETETPVIAATTGSGTCTINVRGGSIVSGSSRAISGSGSTVNISGGSISTSSSSWDAVFGDRITVTGGSISGGRYGINGKSVKLVGNSYSGWFGVDSVGGIDLTEYTGDFSALTVVIIYSGSALDAKLPKGIGLTSNGTVVETVSGGNYGFGAHSYATVRYDANGGSGSMASVYLKSGYTLPANGFTVPSGGTFLAWEVNGTRYNVGDAISSEGDVTVKALWSITRTVSFSANGGEGTMDAVGVGDGGSYVLPANAFTFAHKLFDCWEVNGERKAVGDTIVVTSNLTVKALWLDTYTVTYHINLDGRTDTCLVEDLLGEYTLSHSFEKPFGRSFAGWMTAADGTAAEYQNGDTVTVNADLHLYAFYQDDEAAWGADAQNLIASGTVKEAAAAAYSSSVGYVKLLRDVGSVTLNDGDFIFDFAGHTVGMNQMELVVNGGWTHTVTLTDSSADGSGGAYVTTLRGSHVVFEGGNYFGVNAEGSAGVEVRGGVFTGPFRITDGTAVDVLGGTFRGSLAHANAVFVNNNGTLTISDGTFYLDGFNYLLHSLGDYDNEYNYLEGGTFHGAPAVAEICHENDARLRLSGAWDGFRIDRVNGQAFDTQWLSLPSGFYVFSPDGDDPYSYYKMGAGLHTLSSSQECTVSFDPNGGTGTMESMVETPGYTTLLPDCSFTPPRGCVFLGWSYERDGEVITGSRFVPKGRTMTLYAQWQAVDVSWESLYEGKTAYGTLTDALGAVNNGDALGGYLTLLNNVLLQSNFDLSQDCTIYLNGYMLNNIAQSATEPSGTIFVKKNVTLDIDDATGGAGTVRGRDLIDVRGGNLLISGGTFVAPSSGSLMRLSMVKEGDAMTLPNLSIQALYGDVTFGGQLNRGEHFRFTDACDLVMAEYECTARGAHVGFDDPATFHEPHDNDAYDYVWGTWRPHYPSYHENVALKGTAVPVDAMDPAETYVICNGHTGTGVTYESVEADALMGAPHGGHRINCPCGSASHVEDHVDKVGRENNVCDRCGAPALLEVEWTDAETLETVQGSFYQWYRTVNGDSVKFLTDVVPEETWIVDHDLTVDLNGHTVEVPQVYANEENAVVYVTRTAFVYPTLTINGDGAVMGNAHLAGVRVGEGASLKLNAVLFGTPALTCDEGAGEVRLDGEHARLRGFGDGKESIMTARLRGTVVIGNIPLDNGSTYLDSKGWAARVHLGTGVELLDLSAIVNGEETTFVVAGEFLACDKIKVNEKSVLVRPVYDAAGVESGVERLSSANLAAGDTFRVMDRELYWATVLGYDVDRSEQCFEFNSATKVETVVIATYELADGEKGRMRSASLLSTESGSVKPAAAAPEGCVNRIFFLDADGAPLRPAFEYVSSFAGEVLDKLDLPS